MCGSPRDLDPVTLEKYSGDEEIPTAPLSEEHSIVKLQGNNLRADVLGGHIASPWVKLFKKPAPSSHHLHRPQLEQWCHIREGVCIPMPTDKQLLLMTQEFFQRAEGQPVGPVTAEWRRTTFVWARDLRIKLFGSTGQVTGLWGHAATRFRRRLKHLSLRDKTDIMREIVQGFSHPFKSKPKQIIFAKRNHPNLALKPREVMDALNVQLREQSVWPWNWKLRGHPKGIYSMRWVEKSGTDAVRLTLNGRPLNRSFGKEDVSIVLETHADLRARYVPGMMFMGYDLHHGFYNACYNEDATAWVCFRFHEAELAAEDVADLRKRYPQAWKDDSIYFCYKGLVMGLSPSCKQLTKIIAALMTHWRKCPVKGIAWDITNYIDDSMAMAVGTFRGALQLSLRLLTEYVCLGFSLNLNEKSQIVPTTYYCHIGVLISSSRMRFSLPQRRVLKIITALQDLSDCAVIGTKISAKKVAKVVGMLWSMSIVCHRSVAVMTRGLIRTLAVMLRVPALRGVDDPKRLSYILRRVWGDQYSGRVKQTWTSRSGNKLISRLCRRLFLMMHTPTTSPPGSLTLRRDRLSPTLESLL